MIALPVGGSAVPLLRFRYLNWKSEMHEYELRPESVEFGPYVPGGKEPGIPRARWRWVMHGELISRDGDPRLEMGPNRRRTFLMDGMKELEVVE